MNVTHDAWYVRWFHYNCLVLDRFSHQHVELGDSGEIYSHRLHRYRYSTNLCQFMRTLVLGTLVTLVTVAWYGLILAMVIMPFYLMGTAKVAVIIGIVMAFLVALCALIYFLIEVFPKVFHTVKDALHDMVTPPAEGNPSMTAVIWQWVKGIKNKFCPTITFKS